MERTGDETSTKNGATHVEDEKAELSPIEYPRELDIDLEARGEREGYVLDVNVLKTLTPKWQDYQLSDDGKAVLIPQPTVDDNDPLNWSWWKKHTVLLLIAFAAFLPDYGSATGAVTLIPQSKYVNKCLAILALLMRPVAEFGASRPTKSIIHRLAMSSCSAQQAQ